MKRGGSIGRGAQAADSCGDEGVAETAAALRPGLAQRLWREVPAGRRRSETDGIDPQPVGLDADAQKVL